MDDKENTAPLDLRRDGSIFDMSFLHDASRKGRSKSMGPCDSDAFAPKKKQAYDRRQSAAPATVKGILPGQEDAERKAARRKSMANRRVSFAPEATLHTWDVIDHLREHTTSTDSDSTRRSPQQSPLHYESSPFNPNASRYGSPSNSESSEIDDEADEKRDDDLEGDATSTGMSLDTGDMTQKSSASIGSSTSSSAQLERNLTLAAQTAGTRGIEFDEYGDMSMDMVEEEITNAFQPWAEHETEMRRSSAVFDQENVNPYQMQAIHINAPAMLSEDDRDISMDITRAIGKVLNVQPLPIGSSADTGEETMQFTQIIQQGTTFGMLQAPSLKRPAGSMDEDAQALGLLSSPTKKRRLNYGNDVDGDIVPLYHSLENKQSHTRLSYATIDENEDMSMELTTVLGGIQAPQFLMRDLSPQQAVLSSAPSTPTHSVIPDTKEQSSPVSLHSTRSRREAQSPNRRSSARLQKSTPTPARREVEEKGSDLLVGAEKNIKAGALCDDTTPRSLNGHNEQMSPAATNATTRMVRAAGPIIRASSSPKKAYDDAIQSSPFQSVAASPAPLHVFRGQQAKPAIFSPLAENSRPEVVTSSLTETIKALSTPRKETLKSLSPKKKTPSPLKTPRSSRRASVHPHGMSKPEQSSSSTETNQGPQIAIQPRVKLQTFLDEAGIRFLDLTTSKRRATIAPTPSKLRKLSTDQIDEDLAGSVALDEAIISAACTEPELELYKHACNELRRYIDGGKADIKMLEDATLADTPALIQTYMIADAEQRSTIDAQLRDMKVNARLRSKEMWYGWRSNLVDDLMKVLQSIAEGLLNDDDVLQEKESLVSKVLPQVLEERTNLRAEVDALQAASDDVPDDQKEELEGVREQLQEISSGLEEKRRVFLQLQAQLEERDTRLAELNKHKNECIGVLQEADRDKATSLSNSAEAVAGLKGTIKTVGSTCGWELTSSTTEPPTATMCYKSDLQLICHPLAFMAQDGSTITTPNNPIFLSYLDSASEPPTCQRFFLQLLRAQLHTVQQCSTSLSSLMAGISKTWDMALAVAEARRCMAIECPTEISIHSDECLKIVATIFNPTTRTKFAATLKLLAVSRTEQQIEFVTGTDVNMIYGTSPRCEQAGKCLSEAAAGGPHSWPKAISQLRNFLCASTATPAKKSVK